MLSGSLKVIIPPQVWKRNIVVSMPVSLSVSVCLPVCLRAYLGNYTSNVCPTAGSRGSARGVGFGAEAPRKLTTYCEYLAGKPDHFVYLAKAHKPLVKHEKT